LVAATLIDPFAGIGKPEPFKCLAADTWSRRLSQEHRIEYVAKVQRVRFWQACKHCG